MHLECSAQLSVVDLGGISNALLQFDVHAHNDILVYDLGGQIFPVFVHNCAIVLELRTSRACGRVT